MCQETFLYDFGDGNYRHVNSWNMLLAGAADANNLTQQALQRFTQCRWIIGHTTFQLRGKNSTTELSSSSLMLRCQVMLWCTVGALVRNQRYENNDYATPWLFTVISCETFSSILRGVNGVASPKFCLGPKKFGWSKFLKFGWSKFYVNYTNLFGIPPLKAQNDLKW